MRKTNGSSCSSRLLLGEGQLRPQVNTGNTHLMQGTYLKPVECCLLIPCHLEEQAFMKCRQESTKELHTFHDYLHIINKTMHHT